MKPKRFFVIVHNIRSLYNVGSIFRTADAFGITKIYLTGYTGTPANPIHQKKIAKVALGAEKWVAWEYKPSAVRLIKKLKEQKVKIIALENNISLSLNSSLLRGKGRVGLLYKFKPKFPLALILGEETKGVPKAILKLCDEIIEIPMKGKKESLNVSVAFGIAACHISQLT
jgi:tRNA G18 (ribose-2'-O)-methylase SpoU